MIKKIALTIIETIQFAALYISLAIYIGKEQPTLKLLAGALISGVLFAILFRWVFKASPKNLA